MTATAPAKSILNWASKDGVFRREPSVFRNQLPAPEKGRYILYVSLACPWAHRTLITRALKSLEDYIDVAVVHPHMGKFGWSFYPPVRGEDGSYVELEAPDQVGAEDGIKAVVKDPVHDSKFLREIYFRIEKDYNGRFTVPILFDKQTGSIVNNESSEIIRILNTAFDPVLEPKSKVDLYPEALRAEIDEMNEWTYPTINNGVYRAGFATSQKAYEEAVVPLFESLDRLEKILEGKDYLIGNVLTEADVRVYPTLIRFDPVYNFHFKCNLKTIRDGYPNLNRWMKNLYHSNAAFKLTTNFEHIKHHYFSSHPQINPTRIVPVGPLPPIQPLA